MESLMDLSLEFIDWLQINFPQLKGFFSVLSEFGTFEFYLALITLFYWSINKRLGTTLAIVLLCSSSIHQTLKHAFRDPRPYWIDPSVGLSQEDIYGLPSGHAANSTIVYLVLASRVRRNWFWLLALFGIILMGISRIYLGVHDIPDVLVGLAIGLVIFIVYMLWERNFSIRFSRRILGQRLLFPIVLTGVFVAIYAATMLLIGEPDRDVSWVSFIDAAEKETLSNVVFALTALLSFSAGTILEGSWVRSKADGPIWKRLLRYALGLAITLVLWFGLARYIPEEPTLLALILSALHTLLVVAWVTYYAPWLFVQLRLSESAPRPDIDLTL
jgi:membrane-associated phospholipid phosphatase